MDNARPSAAGPHFPVLLPNSHFTPSPRPPIPHGHPTLPSYRSPVCCVSTLQPLVLAEWKVSESANRPIPPLSVSRVPFGVSPVELTSTPIRPSLLLERASKLFYHQHHSDLSLLCPTVDSDRSRPIQVSQFLATLFVRTSLHSHNRAGPLPSQSRPASPAPWSFPTAPRPSD